MPYVELISGECSECKGIHPILISFPAQNHSFELPGQRPEWSDGLASRIFTFFYEQYPYFCGKNEKQIKDLLYRQAKNPRSNPHELEIEEIQQETDSGPIVILIS